MSPEVLYQLAESVAGGRHGQAVVLGALASIAGTAQVLPLVQDPALRDLVRAQPDQLHGLVADWQYGYQVHRSLGARPVA